MYLTKDCWYPEYKEPLQPIIKRQTTHLKIDKRREWLLYKIRPLYDQKADEKAFSNTGIRKIQMKTIIRSFYILAQRVTFKMTGNTIFWHPLESRRGSLGAP